MDMVPFASSVAAITGGTIVGATLSGCTILASTLSGNTILNSTSSGGTHVGGTFSGNTFLSPVISGGTAVGITLSGSTIIGGTISGTTIVGPVLSGGTSVGMTLSGVAIVGTSTFSGSTITSSGVISTSNTTAASSATTGALTVAGGVGIGGRLWVGGTDIRMISTAPQLWFTESDATADNGKWAWVINAEVMKLRVLNDAEGAAADIFSITRSGATVGTITIGGATTQATNWAQTGATTMSTGTGAISLNGNVTIASGKSLTLGNARVDGLLTCSGYLTVISSSGGTFKIPVSV